VNGEIGTFRASSSKGDVKSYSLATEWVPARKNAGGAARKNALYVPHHEPVVLGQRDEYVSTTTDGYLPWGVESLTRLNHVSYLWLCEKIPDNTGLGFLS